MEFTVKEIVIPSQAQGGTTMIRPYGPGKFFTILDAYVYSVSLDGGADEETATVNGSWYGLMRHGQTIFKDHDPGLESLNEEEREQLTSAAGVIISENSDGFVQVSYFDEKEKLEASWAAIQAEYAATEEEE